MSQAEGGRKSGRRSLILQTLPWLITIACFGFLYSRLAGPAAREGLSVFAYLTRAFASVDWPNWLALMVPYSLLFFLVDSLIVWRVINWFNTRVSYGEILPIRGSSYILSIVNEQVGKGAMGLYLNRRYGVPGWEVGSSMLFIMFCEFYYLLMWATIGYGISSDQLPEEFSAIPWIAGAAVAVFVVFTAFFSGALLKAGKLRDRPLFRAFRQARPWYYLVVILLRSPALIAAVFIYKSAAGLFGLETTLLQMLGFLPMIFFGAAMPLPMRSVAITLWAEVVFPEQKGEAAAFGVVQHNFFIFFNAAIGLIFLRRANRELFGEISEEPQLDPQ
ncbi:MAG: hypothetical protein GY725_09070 [bacterium]|nr:hypothetical protein [bacterium]